MSALLSAIGRSDCDVITTGNDVIDKHRHYKGPHYNRVRYIQYVTTVIIA